MLIVRLNLAEPEGLMYGAFQRIQSVPNGKSSLPMHTLIRYPIEYSFQLAVDNFVFNPELSLDNFSH
jgi:hypothetical protein